MTDTIDQHQVPALRGEGGRFLPGTPGGPGRPRGLSHSEKVRLLLEPHREEFIGRILDLVRNPDPFAAANGLRIALERLAPAPKQEAEKIVVPGLAEATTFTAKCEVVIAAIATGEISTEAGERVLRLLDIYRLAVKHDDHERRLEAIEKGRAAQVVEADGSDLV